MKKQLLSIIITLAMLLCFVSLTAFAVEPLKITVSEHTAEPGDTVAVTVSVANNPGLASLKFDVAYDSVLTLMGVTFNDAFGPMVTAPEPYRNPEPLTMIAPLSDVTANGVFATLTFKVAADAPSGHKAQINITYDADNIYNGDYTNVSVSVSNGYIAVSCPHTDIKNVPETPADCDEVGYTAGVWCNDCDTYISGHKELPATGEHTDADGEWESDEVYHFRTCACGHTFDRFSHSGGTATCHEKAKCQVCGEEHGVVNKDNHTGGTELINVSAADHKAQIPGYSGDTKCLGCGEIIVSGQTIEPGTHIPSNNWSCSDTHHWKICSIEGCGVVIDGSEAAHDSTGSNKANCKEQGVCDVCADVFAPIDPTNHVNCTETDTEPPSCSDVGYTSGVWCDDCETYVTGHEEIPATGEHTDADGEWESDEVYHFRTCACGHTFDSFSHSGGTATCHEKAKCEVCGSEHGTVNKNNHTGGTLIVNFSAPDHKNQIIGNTGDTKCLGCGEIITYGAPIIPGAHIPSGGWSMDRTHHWKVCGIDGCGAVIDETKEQHVFGDDGACSACGIKHNTVTSFNSDTYPVTLRLLDALGNEVASTEAVDGSYLLAAPNGNYTLEVSKKDHTTRIYTVTVDFGYVVQDVKIHLVGDINGDGKVNTTDVGRANAHAKKTNLLEGYELSCADVSGDGKVNTTDVGRMNAHAKKTSLLW